MLAQKESDILNLSDSIGSEAQSELTVADLDPLSLQVIFGSSPE